MCPITKNPGYNVLVARFSTFEIISRPNEFIRDISSWLNAFLGNVEWNEVAYYTWHLNPLQPCPTHLSLFEKCLPMGLTQDWANAAMYCVTYFRCNAVLHRLVWACNEVKDYGRHSGSRSRQFLWTGLAATHTQHILLGSFCMSRLHVILNDSVLKSSTWMPISG